MQFAHCQNLAVYQRNLLRDPFARPILVLALVFLQLSIKSVFNMLIGRSNSFRRILAIVMAEVKCLSCDVTVLEMSRTHHKCASKSGTFPSGTTRHGYAQYQYHRVHSFTVGFAKYRLGWRCNLNIYMYYTSVVIK